VRPKITLRRLSLGWGNSLSLDVLYANRMVDAGVWDPEEVGHREAGVYPPYLEGTVSFRRKFSSFYQEVKRFASFYEMLFSLRPIFTGNGSERKLRIKNWICMLSSECEDTLCMSIRYRFWDIQYRIMASLWNTFLFVTILNSTTLKWNYTVRQKIVPFCLFLQ